jgi:TPR repeat protein
MRIRNLIVNFLAIATFAAIALSLQLPKLNQRIGGQTLEDTRKAVREESARLKLLKQLPAKGFGFNNMIANFAFLQFLQYFGDDVSRNTFKTGYTLSPQYFENIITRDPRFVTTYIYLSSSVSMFAGAPDQAIAFYSKGAESLNPDIQPHAYVVWRFKATDQLLFVGDAKGARDSYGMAAEWADRAARNGKGDIDGFKRVAELSRQSAQWLTEDRDLSKAQISAWSMVLGNAVDKKTIEIVAQKLDPLGMKIDVRDGALVVVEK